MSKTEETQLKSVAKSGIISRLTESQTQLSEEDVELAVGTILEKMAAGLIAGERVEIRGFGSMSLHYRPPRTGRNPKTGNRVEVSEKFVPHFKPGSELKARVDKSIDKA